MPAPLERDRQYQDKYAPETWPLEVDFTDRLPPLITLASSGHTVKITRLSDGTDQTSAVCSAPPTPDGTGMKLLLTLKATTDPTLLGDYYCFFLAFTTAVPAAQEGQPVWLRIRPVPES